MSYYQQHIFVCTNQKKEGKECCANRGGSPYVDYLKEKLKSLKVFGPDGVRVSSSGCLGRCSLGPCLVIYPEGIWYTYESFADLDEIIEGQIFNNTKIPHLLLASDPI